MRINVIRSYILLCICFYMYEHCSQSTHRYFKWKLKWNQNISNLISSSNIYIIHIIHIIHPVYCSRCGIEMPIVNWNETNSYWFYEYGSLNLPFRYPIFFFAFFSLAFFFSFTFSLSMYNFENVVQKMVRSTRIDREKKIEIT